MRLVIDTNIIVSALLSEDSKAFRALSDALDGKYTLFCLIGFEKTQFGLKYQNLINR